MARARLKWTDEEDEILVQAVLANPHNRAAAFREAAKQVYHSEASCCSRWYKIKGNPGHEKYAGALFTMVSHTSYLENRTSDREGVKVNPKSLIKGLWKKVKTLLKLN